MILFIYLKEYKILVRCLYKLTYSGSNLISLYLDIKTKYKDILMSLENIILVEYNTLGFSYCLYEGIVKSYREEKDSQNEEFINIHIEASKSYKSSNLLEESNIPYLFSYMSKDISSKHLINSLKFRKEHLNDFLIVSGVLNLSINSLKLHITSVEDFVCGNVINLKTLESISLNKEDLVNFLECKILERLDLDNVK